MWGAIYLLWRKRFHWVIVSGLVFSENLTIMVWKFEVHYKIQTHARIIKSLFNGGAEATLSLIGQSRNVDDIISNPEMLMILYPILKCWWYCIQSWNVDDIVSNPEMLMILYPILKCWWYCIQSWNVDDIVSNPEMLMLLYPILKCWWYCIQSWNVDDIASNPKMLMILHPILKCWWYCIQS